jgi:hypothetical protein
MREADLETLIYKALRAAGAFLPQSVKEVAAAEAEFDESTVELPDSLRDPAVILRRRQMRHGPQTRNALRLGFVFHPAQQCFGIFFGGQSD